MGKYLAFPGQVGALALLGHLISIAPWPESLRELEPAERSEILQGRGQCSRRSVSREEGRALPARARKGHGSASSIFCPGRCQQGL